MDASSQNCDFATEEYRNLFLRSLHFDLEQFHFMLSRPLINTPSSNNGARKGYHDVEPSDLCRTD